MLPTGPCFVICLSELRRFTVTSPDSADGRLADLVVDVSGEGYPPVTHLVVRRAWRDQALVAWSSVERIDWARRQFVSRARRFASRDPRTATTPPCDVDWLSSAPRPRRLATAVPTGGTDGHPRPWAGRSCGQSGYQRGLFGEYLISAGSRRIRRPGTPPPRDTAGNWTPSAGVAGAHTAARAPTHGGPTSPCRWPFDLAALGFRRRCSPHRSGSVPQLR